MRQVMLKVLVTLLGLVSLAEELRLAAYGMPIGPALSIGWALVAGALLWRIGKHRPESRLGRFGWRLPLVVLAATFAAYFVGSGGHEQLMVVPMALILALPLITVVITAIRLNPSIALRLQPLPIPASILVTLLGIIAAAPPAWNMVSAVQMSDPDFAFTSAHAGCFELTTGRWSSTQLGHSTMSPSRFVRLDTTRGQVDVEDRPIGAAFERGKPIIRPGWIAGSAYWEPVDSNRVALHWNNGYHGTRVLLKRQGTGYRGRAISHTDVVSGFPSPRATVTATPVSCDSVPADSSRLPGAWKRFMDKSQDQYSVKRMPE